MDAILKCDLSNQEATELSCPVVLFNYNGSQVVLTFDSVVKSQTVTIQMKSMERYFPVILFMLSGGNNFESVDKIVKCDHLNGRY